jgi:hypothetical protein
MCYNIKSFIPVYDKKDSGREIAFKSLPAIFAAKAHV